MTRPNCMVLLVVAKASALTLAAGQARAVVAAAAPTWPIPSDAPAAPPPIPTLPTAGDVPPPQEAIADPVTQAASCGSWYRQSSYAERWPAGSTWWEYRCTSDYSFYYNPCTVGACPAFCPECYFEARTQTDRFYWNGSEAVFYGQEYYYTFSYTETYDFPPIETSAWWDASAARWYVLQPPQPPPPPPNVPPTASFSYTCSGLTCSFDGSASSDPDGAIWAGDYDWSFGDASYVGGRSTLDHTYARSGTYSVTLTVRDNSGATGTMTKEVTVEGPPPPNAPPTASFTYICSGLTCTFRDGGSSDPDGTIGAYAWNFGDGSGQGGTLATTQHTYFQAGTYTVGLTVTDNGGASNTQWQVISVKPNAPPSAALTVTCTGVRCMFDATGSADSDGTIATYAWSFGDGSAGTGATPTHDYPKAGTYTVTLTVTDNDGASAVTSRRINPISLSARGFKQNGQQKVDLSWNGAAGVSFDVYRDGAKIAAVQATAYTDVAPKGPGSRSYRVCASAEPTCSSDATVTF